MTARVTSKMIMIAMMMIPNKIGKSFSYIGGNSRFGVGFDMSE